MTNETDIQDTIRELADEAVADHGTLTDEERDTLRKFQIEQHLDAKNTDTTNLGHVASRGAGVFAEHSGYENGRRA